MKIGILTFHRAINYGAVLQCYALYQTLSKWGHDVEVIDYRPTSIEKYRMFFRKKDLLRQRGLKKKLKYLLSCLSLIKSKKTIADKFDCFLMKNMSFSNVVKNSEDIPQDYDIIIFGSDQIWSPEHCEGLDKIYYGQFAKGHARFYTYAVSIGRLELIKEENAINFQKYIQVFDKISVREIHVQDFLRNRFGKKSDVVCDPALLMREEDIYPILNQSKEDNYVLLFNFVGGVEAVNFTTHIAEQLNARVIELKAVISPFRKKRYMRTNLSPGDFLSYIRNARCVVTDSFHATIFSIIMHKDFYTLLRHNNNDRSKTILSYLGLADRQIDKRNSVSFSSVSYAGVDEKIEKLRQYSISFLINNIDGQDT